MSVTLGLRLAAVVVVGVVAMAAGGRACRGDLVAAEFHPGEVNMDGGVLGTERYRPGQTFTVLESGPLAEVSLLLSRNGLVLPPLLVVRLRDVDSAGSPAAVLATSGIPNPALGERTHPALVAADFTGSGVVLRAGATYALTLDLEAGGAAWHGVDTSQGMGGPGPGLPEIDGYAGGGAWETFDFGATWRSRPELDFGFRVGVIPEPGTGALLLLGSGLPWLATGWASNRWGRGRSISPRPGR